MKIASIALAVSFALVACSGSDPSRSPGSGTTAPTPVVTPAPPITPTPSPSGLGFCVDRDVIGDVFRLVRAGSVPYREAAAYVTAASKVMQVDVSSASTDLGAKKLRQFALYLNTLRLAILGSAENYPDDFAVRQFANGLAGRLQDISAELDCPA